MRFLGLKSSIIDPLPHIRSGCTIRERTGCGQASGGGEPLLLGVDIEVGDGPLEVEGAEVLDQELGDGPVAVPLAVRRNDEPGSATSVLQRSQRIACRPPVSEPSFSRLDVARVVLPILGPALRRASNRSFCSTNWKCAGST